MQVSAEDLGMDRAQHWQRVYTTKGEREVSWFQDVPDVSLRMMRDAGLTADSCVIDVGGGDSHLVDALVGLGLECLAVLDVSQAALDRAKARLGAVPAFPTWIQADVTGDWSLKPMDIWHDRAVFHFLVDAGSPTLCCTSTPRHGAPRSLFNIHGSRASNDSIRITAVVPPADGNSKVSVSTPAITAKATRVVQARQ
jgi:hypothetical protein